MPPQSARADETKTRRRIVKLLKTEGAMDSASLAGRLHVTAMAVRQHLYALQHEKLVSAEERPAPLGRPAKFWRLTKDAERLFPDAYAELNAALITSVQDAFGPDGMVRLLDARVARQRTDYRSRITASAPLAKRVRQLAQIRADEGYMAEVKRDGRGYLFIENHCPICAAATACQGFCASELDLFRSALGPGVSVERAEHILSGDRRCAYRIAQSG
ncbi:MAG: metalloregulator ArsR/SmtB family transcription factor [Vicinamibacterales bacterium]